MKDNEISPLRLLGGTERPAASPKQRNQQGPRGPPWYSVHWWRTWDKGILSFVIHFQCSVRKTERLLPTAISQQAQMQSLLLIRDTRMSRVSRGNAGPLSWGRGAGAAVCRGGWGEGGGAEWLSNPDINSNLKGKYKCDCVGIKKRTLFTTKGINNTNTLGAKYFQKSSPGN